MLSSCSLADAFDLGVSDEPAIDGGSDNATACRDYYFARQDENFRCTGETFPPPVDVLCPERLNERDPGCASIFQCRQDSLSCVDGIVEEDPTCAEGVDKPSPCNDPFENIPVAIHFSVAFDGPADCGEAGVVGLGASFENSIASGLSDLGPCTLEEQVFTIDKATFPFEFGIVGFDGPFEPGVANAIFASTVRSVEVSDIESDEVYLGALVLEPL